MSTGVWVAAAVALILLAATALTGDLDPGRIIAWYYDLRRPPWQPPDWVVPVVWAFIYATIAYAVRRAWRAAPERRTGLGYALVANLFLNFIWPLLFFTHQRLDIALWVAALLTLSVVPLMTVTERRSPGAGWWLVPYLLWTSFATALNFTLLRLNGPYG